jgi:hypothetical protein
VEIAVNRLNPQAALLDGVHMQAAGDKGDIFAGLGQPPAKISTDTAGAENCKSHGNILSNAIVG